MKKQLLHEDHNRQDKAKKPEYQENFHGDGGNYDRGGAPKQRLLTFRGSSLHINIKDFLFEDKQSLIRDLECNWKYKFGGATGTVEQLMKNPRVAGEVKERIERTKLSVIRANVIVEIAMHPRKNRKFQVVEFKCFLQPLELFTNPIFKRDFAFRALVAKPRVSNEP